MIKERTLIETYCDICNTVHPSPVAIAGYSSSGWESINGYDLCSICSGLLKLKAIEKLSTNELKDMIDEIAEQRGDCSTNASFIVSSVV